MRHVGLPALVGERDLEPDGTRPGPLLRLGDDTTAPPQDPHDGAQRRGGPVAIGKVEEDGLGSGVEALFGQLLAQEDDLVLDLPGDGRRRTVQGLERGSRPSSPSSR